YHRLAPPSRCGPLRFGKDTPVGSPRHVRISSDSRAKNSRLDFRQVAKPNVTLGSLMEYETGCDACLPPTAVIAGRKREGTLRDHRGSPEKPCRSADSRSSA